MKFAFRVLVVIAWRWRDYRGRFGGCVWDLEENLHAARMLGLSFKARI